LTLSGSWLASVLLLIMIPISVMLAHIMERLVERPFNDWGHTISRGLKSFLGERAGILFSWWRH
jgi:peptidoglycan/LPS O-acetylase OafA/YrhL